MMIQMDIEEDQYTMILTYREVLALKEALSHKAIVEFDSPEQAQLAHRMYRMLRSALTLTNQGDDNG